MSPTSLGIATDNIGNVADTSGGHLYTMMSATLLTLLLTYPTQSPVRKGVTEISDAVANTPDIPRSVANMIGGFADISKGFQRIFRSIGDTSGGLCHASDYSRGFSNTRRQFPNCRLQFQEMSPTYSILSLTLLDVSPILSGLSADWFKNAAPLSTVTWTVGIRSCMLAEATLEGICQKPLPQ